MGVVQAIKLMRSSIPGQIPALPMAQVAVNLTDKILFVGVDGTTDNVIKFVDVGGVASMISTATDAYLPKEGGTITGDLTVNGDLVITGETITANVETMTVKDPIITLGGTTAPTVEDAFDRGIEFHWYSGSAKKGFFGFDMDEQKFTFIPDTTNTNVGTIVANFQGALTGNASTATKLQTARTIWGRSFDGTADISGAIEDATTGAFSSNVTIGGTLGVVTGNTTLAGGLFDYSQKTITFSYGVGITSGALTISGKTGMETPYLDFRKGVSGTALSRIISLNSGELSIFGKQVNGEEQSGGKIKLKSDTYAEKALYIGGASGAKLVFVPASGNTPAYLKLANYDGGVMHFVTTGGQTMYSEGVPAGGGGGSATVILNGETNDNPRFWAPIVAGTTTGQYLKWNNTTGIPEWGTLPTVTKAQIEAVLTDTISSHDHTFASLKAKPNTIDGYGITDAVYSSHLTGGSAHGVATTGANGFMSSSDKTNLNLLYTNRLIYDAGDKEDLAAALTSIPSAFYKEGLLLKYADANEQHIYMYISTAAMDSTTKTKQENWLRISKPDVDGGTY